MRFLILAALAVATWSLPLVAAQGGEIEGAPVWGGTAGEGGEAVPLRMTWLVTMEDELDGIRLTVHHPTAGLLTYEYVGLTAGRQPVGVTSAHTWEFVADPLQHANAIRQALGSPNYSTECKPVQCSPSSGTGVCNSWCSGPSFVCICTDKKKGESGTAMLNRHANTLRRAEELWPPY